MSGIYPGDDLWVVERNEDGEATDVVGFMYIASAAGYAICTSFINMMTDIGETLEYHAHHTAGYFDTDLSVFPESDCFATKEEADKKYNSEVKNNE